MSKKVLCFIVCLACVFSITMSLVVFAESNVVYEENFNDGKADGITFLPDSGDIKVVDDNGNKVGQITRNAAGDGYLHAVFGPEVTDFTLEMKVKPTFFKTNDWHWGKICFRTGMAADGNEAGENKSYYVGLWQWRTQLVMKNTEIGKADDNTVAENQDIVFEANKWYNLKVVAKGNTFDIFVDGEKAFTYTDKDNTLPKGKFAFSGWGAEYMVDDIKITSGEATSDAAAPAADNTAPVNSAASTEAAANPKTADVSVIPYAITVLAGAAGLVVSRRKKN